MRRVFFGPMPDGGDPDAFRRWVSECFNEIDRAAYEDSATIFDDFTVSNHTPTRTIDAGTATATDLINAFCTLVEDMKKRGMKRSQ